MNELKVLLNRVETALKLLAYNSELSFVHQGIKYEVHSVRRDGTLVITLGYVNTRTVTDREMIEKLSECAPNWIPFYDEGEFMGWSIRCEVLL